MSQGSPEVKKRYDQSEKGRATRDRQNHSEAGLARKKRYTQTEKFKAAQRRYHQSDKGRAALARGVHKRRGLMAIESTLTAEEWRQIKALQKERCLYCGAKTALTMDHIVPLSKGGPHTPANVVAACRSCNSAKGNQGGT